MGIAVLVAPAASGNSAQTPKHRGAVMAERLLGIGNAGEVGISYCVQNLAVKLSIIYWGPSIVLLGKKASFNQG